jgi:hypothetical protein
MRTATTGTGLRRTTGGLFVASALAFAVSATVSSSTIDWPDILRQSAGVVLPAFAAGGNSLVWTWFATSWTYGLLLVPVLLLPAALGRRRDLALRVATYVGAVSVVLSMVGFLRWVFVVSALPLRRRRRHHQGCGGRRLDRSERTPSCCPSGKQRKPFGVGRPASALAWRPPPGWSIDRTERVLGQRPRHRSAHAPMTELGVLLEAKAVHTARSAHLLALAHTNGIGRPRVDEVIEMVGCKRRCRYAEPSPSGHHHQSGGTTRYAAGAGGPRTGQAAHLTAARPGRVVARPTLSAPRGRRTRAT